jgi:hypothetical protein
MSEAEPGFLIDGEHYPFPTLDSLDLDEAELLYLATGWGPEDFVFDPDDEQAEEIAKRIIRPTTLKAMARIAYRRRHPSVDDKTVAKLAGKSSATHALVSLFASGGEESPPVEESTSGPDGSSRTSSVDSSESSGTDSTTSSDAPVGGQPITSTLELVTPSPDTPALMPAASGQ